MVATIERKEESTTATIVICFFEFITKEKLPYNIKVISLLRRIISSGDTRAIATGNQYYRAFIHGCMSEGNTKVECESAADAY